MKIIPDHTTGNIPHSSAGKCSQRFLLVFFLIESIFMVGKVTFSSFVTGFLSGTYREWHIKIPHPSENVAVVCSSCFVMCCIVFLF